MSKHIPGQLSLFPELEEKPAPPPPVAACAPPASVTEWLKNWPEGLRVGTSSWSFPGWSGLIYERSYSESRLSRAGLRAYASHPQLRAVGIDRTYYAPMSREDFAHYAEQVPQDFRFLVKAPERLTTARFSRHPRYGSLAGLDNPEFLLAEKAMVEWIEPARQGLGSKLGALLLQFPPTAPAAVGGAAGFALRLHHFLEQLPEGLPYAVEIRNGEWMTRHYAQVLQRLGVSHCWVVHPQMPSLEVQHQLLGLQPQCLVRWMLGGSGRDDWNYERAVQAYEPYHRLVDPDPLALSQILDLWRESLQQAREVLTIVNNKAEGCAPRSIERLLAAWFASATPC